MTLYSDHIGAFIQGVTDPEELRGFIQQKFSEAEIQYAYEKMLADTKTVAKAEKIPLLKAFWKVLDHAYATKAPPLTCGKGCSHCCYTGVAHTQLEWDGMVNGARDQGIDLNEIMERSEKTIQKVAKTLESGIDPERVDWYHMVINQRCPFLDDEEACVIHEDRPLDCRLMVAFREVCASKSLEHAQRGVLVEEAVAPTVIARLQYETTPKIKRRKFTGSQKLKIIQHWLLTWKNKKSGKKKR